MKHEYDFDIGDERAFRAEFEFVCTDADNGSIITGVEVTDEQGVEYLLSDFGPVIAKRVFAELERIADKYAPEALQEYEQDRGDYLADMRYEAMKEDRDE